MLLILTLTSRNTQWGPFFRGGDAVAGLWQPTRAQMHIRGTSLFECLRVNVVVLDAGEDEIVVYSEPEAPVKTHLL